MHNGGSLQMQTTEAANMQNEAEAAGTMAETEAAVEKKKHIIKKVII